MKRNPLTFPLSSINPVLELSYGEPGTEAKKGVIVLKDADLRTPWMTDFLDEMKPSPLSFQLTLRSEGRLIRARLRLALEPELECSRSLTLFRERFEVDTDAFFRPAEDIEAEEAARPGHEHELTEEDFSSYAFQGGSVAVDEFLLDAMRTALPLFPLCRPDCRGLCSECGTVLNDRGRCGREVAIEGGDECPHFPTDAN